MRLKLFASLFLAVSLTACTGLGGLTHQQIRVLERHGFHYDQTEGWLLALPEELLFAVNEADLNEKAVLSIRKLSHDLQSVQLNQLEIHGHTDSTGNSTYNQALSLRRAESVAGVFRDSLYRADQLKVMGFGSDKPIADNATEEGRSKNRRVDIIIDR